jgi:DNA-binding MarR family transcriptional regulator
MEISKQQVCQDILSLLNRFKLEMLRVAETQNLTQMQLGALYMLHQHGELAMGEVAHVLHCDPSNITGIVDRLVSHQLVSRQESTRDRRTKTISLTQKGTQVVGSVIALLPERMECGRLTEAERQAIHSVAQKLATAS